MEFTRWFIVVPLIVIALVIAQVYLAKLKNPYYGYIVPLVASATSYSLIAAGGVLYTLAIVGIPFALFVLLYHAIRYHHLHQINESRKIDIKDL